MARTKNVGLSRPRTRSINKANGAVSGKRDKEKEKEKEKEKDRDRNHSHNHSHNHNGTPPLRKSNSTNKEFITPTKSLKRVNNSASQINSSPIKKIRLSPLHNNQLQLSSPIPLKKSVAFSDDLISDLPSSPDKSTPRKSILKSVNYPNDNSTITDPNNTQLWDKIDLNSKNGSGYGPSNSEFWIQGTIIQLPSNSPRLSELIDGCIINLSDTSFNKRFEVYATLNNIFKTNPIDQLKRLLTNSNKDTHHIIELSSIIKNDVIKLESKLFENESDKENTNSNTTNKNDPFRIRILNQALKLISSIMLEQELNNFMPIEDAKWYYLHASEILLKSNVSKAIVTPYLVLIKDCRFNSKRKKLLLDSKVFESVLLSLINMKSYPSSSLITERFLCFKNFVINFPLIMAQYVHHWLGTLILNVCNLPSAFFTKCIAVGTNTLLEVAKAYLSNSSISIVVDKLLSSSISSEIKSLTCDGNLQVDSPNFNSQKSTALEYIFIQLEQLMKDGEYKVSMDIWVAITIMLSNNKIPFCNWEHLTKWLRIPKICFNSRNITAQIISLNSWKAVVYNLSYRDLEYVKGVIEPILRNSTTIDERNQAITNVLKSKTRLTTHLFNSINACDAPEDVINALHNLFLSILYSFINPMTNNNNQGTKYLYIYWDKIIQPIILNFYFKKDASTPYMHDLGLMVLNRLMRFSNNQSNERKFNEVRCLANDPVTLAEVNPLPNRWIYARFDKVVHSLALVFQSNHLTIEKKFNFLQSFLNYIKPITKKEIRPTKSTITMMENISVMFYQLLNPDLSFELINKTLTAFLDTFEPSLLFSKESRNITRDTYLKVIEISLNKFTDNQITCLLKLMFPVTSDGADLIMILDLSIIQDKEKNKALEEFLEEFFNSRIVSSKLSEVESCGEICTVLPIGFETFIKKVVQAVVTITNTEDLSKGLEYLKVNSWKSENYKFFLRLMKNAPNPLIQEFVVDSIKFKISDNNSFVDLFKFLVEDKFYSQLSCIHQEIITSGSKLEGFLLFNFRDIFSQYLTDVSLNPTLIEDLDNLLVDNHKNLQINIDIFIKKNIGILPKVRKSLGLELGLSNAEEMSAEMSAEISETSNDSKPEETQVDETQVDTTPAVNIEESTENEVSEIPSEKVLELVNLDEIDVSSSSEAVVSGESIESHDSNSHENPVTNGSFDIHSFTAMLNSKLQTASPSKAKGRKRKQKKSSDESQSPKVSKRGKSKVEVSSSVESIDEISESENDSLSQTTMGNDSEMVDDESISNNSEIETHNTDKQTQIEIPLEQSDNSEIIDDFVKHEDDMIIESQSGETDSGSSSNSQLVTFESQNFKGHSTSNEGNVTDISKESISESISSSSLSSSDGSLVLVTKEMVLSTIVEHEPADMQEPPEVPDIVPETTEVIPEVTEAIEETTKTISETTEAIPETNEAIPNTIEAIPETNDTQVNETQSNSLLKSLETVLNISDEDIRNLDAQDKYDLETKLLQLMLRVRNVGMRN